MSAEVEQTQQLSEPDDASHESPQPSEPDNQGTTQPPEKAHVAWYKRIRWWGWTLIGILAAIILIIGAFGVQSLMIKNHEEKAISAVTDTVKTGDLDQLPQAIEQMQNETAKADSLARSGLWALAAHMPGLGQNITSLQDMTALVHKATVETVPAYMDIVEDMPMDTLFANGQIHIEPLQEAEPKVVAANESLRGIVEEYEAIPRPTIGPIASVYDKGKTLLNKGLDAAEWTITDIFPHLRDWLGYDAQQNYAILAMTPSEARASGGLIGAIGIVTINEGKIEVGDFKNNGSYFKYGFGTQTEDEQRIYRDQGPIHMYYDIRDFANYPDTQRIAEEFLRFWDKEHEDDGQLLTGVAIADPVFVQTLVKVFGDVTLPDGTVLTGTNTADFLMNTVYKDYPVAEQDAFFGLVAKQCVSRLMEDANMGKIAELASDSLELAQERHFNVWFFNPYLAPIGLQLGLVASIPTSEEAPEVGIYLTEQNPSKMSYYIDRKATIDEIDCGSSYNDPNGTKYRVTYTLTNTLTQEEVSKLPVYITGMDAIGRGTGYEKIAFYPPQGGTISNWEVSGNGSIPTADVVNLRYMFHTLTQVQPGRSVTYSFDVQVSPNAKEELRIDQTPSQKEKADVTYTKSCPITE